MKQMQYLFMGPIVLSLIGCGTTRMTDTQRTATEQLLVSNAVDQAVSQMDFKHLAGKPVFFDPQYLDGVVDRGYLISSIRQHLLASGCLLQEDRNKADYVVEARSGAVGTNRNSVLVGVPQMNIPAMVPGQPSFIPEIPLAKKTDQEGVAKIAVFAFNRRTGSPVWQSGVVQSNSTAKDRWVLGAGPFQQGTIRNGTQFAGEPLPIPTFGGKDDEETVTSSKLGVTDAAVWQDGPAATSSMKPTAILTSVGPAMEPIKPDSLRPVVPSSASTEATSVPGRGSAWNLIGIPASENTVPLPAPPAFTPPPAEASKPDAPPPFTPPSIPLVNKGGQDETQPSQIMTAGYTSGTPVPVAAPMNWYGSNMKR